MSGEIIAAIVGAAVGSAVTGLVGVFAGWWTNKTVLPVTVIEEIGRLKGTDEKFWEKLIMVRKILENAGMKIPDREWGYDEGRKSK